MASHGATPMKYIRLADPKWEAAARVLLRLELNGDCWVWPGPVDGSGYASVRMRNPRRFMKIHRLLYEVFVGPIPEGLTIDHLCRKRTCANPAHLEAVTLRENVLRGTALSAQRARQTHCKHGHPLTGENVRVDKRNRRLCRTCAKRHQDERIRPPAPSVAGLRVEVTCPDCGQTRSIHPASAQRTTRCHSCASFARYRREKELV